MDDPKGSISTYEKLSGIIRTWLTSYGIVFFAFVVSQATIVEALKGQKEAAKLIFVVMIVGLAIQVASALVYKLLTAWEYHALLCPEFKKIIRYKLAKGFNELYLLEIGFDVATVLCYLYGTYKMASIIAGIL